MRDKWGYPERRDVLGVAKTIQRDAAMDLINVGLSISRPLVKKTRRRTTPRRIRCRPGDNDYVMRLRDGGRSRNPGRYYIPSSVRMQNVRARLSDDRSAKMTRLAFPSRTFHLLTSQIYACLWHIAVKYENWIYEKILQKYFNKILQQKLH